jgi:hypothetical protein
MLMVKGKIDNVDAAVPLVSDKCDNNCYQITNHTFCCQNFNTFEGLRVEKH